ncbi:MAG: Txe/YoeB family addiction module toxin [Alphaproteobacteria bacterium]|nr:Txe/YoeB family addiction module toxin [Alphaproteobacteria bacterium]
MRLIWSDESWDDYLYWQKNDPDIMKKINRIIKDTKRDPFNGLGKPEPLKEYLKGWWSRRITGEHRLVYRISGSGVDQVLEIAQCRYRYN